MEPPPLSPSIVHVWTASLAVDGDTLDRRRAALCDEERSRGDRFLDPKARSRFIVARATLRHLLAAYTGRNVTELAFAYGAHGKPYLSNGADLRFNLSHTADRAMIAVALRRDIGIDVEATARDADIEGVSRKVFSTDERAQLLTLDPDERRAAFFRIWTRKEAYIKARGEGFGYPTRSFSVSDTSLSQDALLADQDAAAVQRPWRIVSIVAPEGFCAALAAEGRGWSLKQFDVPAL